MRNLFFMTAMIVLVIVVAGCSVNTKLIERERVDQEVVTAGNRGYLVGTPPPAGERKTTREYYEIQVEVPPVIEKESRVPKVEKEDEEVTRGTPIYIAPEIPEKRVEKRAELPERVSEEFVSYTVQKGDTLQKISQKFYGTTKKWRKIFLANQDKLSAPDKVYPGQALKIPQGATKESEYIK